MDIFAHTVPPIPSVVNTRNAGMFVLFDPRVYRRLIVNESIYSLLLKDAILYLSNILSEEYLPAIEGSILSEGALELPRIYRR